MKRYKSKNSRATVSNMVRHCTAKKVKEKKEESEISLGMKIYSS
jgi:hypothetical protein